MLLRSHLILPLEAPLLSPGAKGQEGDIRDD
jgi:hypothetical protein